MTYNIDIINLSIYHYNNNNKNLVKISKILNISHNTMYRWYNKYKNYYNNYTALTIEDINNNKKIHGLNKINNYEKKILEYIDNNNINYIKDILINNEDIKISRTSISRIIKKNNYSYKKVRNNIIPYDINILNNKRYEFCQNITDEEYLDSISIDESSFCINDYNKYGYSKKNTRINRIFKHKHVRERKTLISAISKDSIIFYKIINGSLKSDIYLNFIKSNIEYFRNKTILNDNVSSHRSKILKDYCNENNIKLIFIPPYTPQLNPIEEHFSELKKIFRDKEHNNLEEDITNTINISNQNNLKKYFEHSVSFLNKYRTI